MSLLRISSLLSMCYLVPKFDEYFFYPIFQSFIREHIGKYLDDNFNQFSHLTKALICLNSAEVYNKVSGYL